MTTEQLDGRKVKRVCRVIGRDGKPCGRVFYVNKGSRDKGCPDCCPRLTP